MYFLYNLVVLFARFILRIVALFDEKIGFFVNGRKNTFDLLQNNISSDDKVLWVHAASLGEFEQGRPIIESFKKKYPMAIKLYSSHKHTWGNNTSTKIATKNDAVSASPVSHLG